MLDRTQIEHFLQLNDISPTAPDEEIKSILISASWQEEDVNTAIMILREGPPGQEPRVDSFHRVFHSDDRLKPEAVSALLGIEMSVSSDDIALRRAAKRGLTAVEVVRLIGISVTLSALSIVFAMWYFEVGFFHVTIR